MMTQTVEQTFIAVKLITPLFVSEVKKIGNNFIFFRNFFLIR